LFGAGLIGKGGQRIGWEGFGCHFLSSDRSQK
jgi:hypothetical protein